MARILTSNKFESFIVEGTPGPLYDDLWTIRSHLFPGHSHRFKFKKQFNGVWVEVSPDFNPSVPPQVSLDLFDGEEITQSLSRGAIGSRLILDKPAKIRFPIDLLSEVDITKLETLASLNNYECEWNNKFITFTKKEKLT